MSLVTFKCPQCDTSHQMFSFVCRIEYNTEGRVSITGGWSYYCCSDFCRDRFLIRMTRLARRKK